MVTGVFLLVVGIALMGTDIEAAFALVLCASISFLIERVFSRGKKHGRRFHIVNLKDGTEIIREG